jgi:hypothetical protein
MTNNLSITVSGLRKAGQRNGQYLDGRQNQHDQPDHASLFHPELRLEKLLGSVQSWDGSSVFVCLYPQEQPKPKIVSF